MTMLTTLAAVLRAAGLRVVEVPGWQTRAAGSPGGFDPRGILVHHTGSSGDGLGYARWMALEGRADLTAPLANLSLGRDGTFYVLAAGRAHHAGRCRPVAGLSTLPGLPYGDGNTQLLGIECHNTGTEGWTPAQRGALVTGCAALNVAYEWPASRTLGHIETSTAGKWDPGKLPLDQLRRDVAATMEGQTDMMTPRDVWAYEYKERQALGYLVTTDANARAARAEAQAIRADLGALTAVVSALASQIGGVTPEQLRAAAEEGAAAALNARIADADVTLEVTPAPGP